MKHVRQNLFVKIFGETHIRVPLVTFGFKQLLYDHVPYELGPDKRSSEKGFVLRVFLLRVAPLSVKSLISSSFAETKIDNKIYNLNLVTIQSKRGKESERVCVCVCATK